ncbi:MAG: MBL fold metallo-hydrolase [Bacteroidales bacterium]|nr:MBL fold metallo-hydrolase [Bacteroidales bacterium]
MKSWQTTDGNTIIRILSGRSNSFLLTNGKQHVLIDTGPKNMWKKLQNRLNALQIDHIDFLILTHAHFDHAGNAHRIKEKYNSRVIVHRNDATHLAAGNEHHCFRY